MAKTKRAKPPDTMLARIVGAQQKPITIVGTAQQLYCSCKRGPSGTVRDGHRDPDCIFEDKEVLYDGAAGTAKTFSDLVRVYALMNTYPRIRVLGLRRTFKSMAESIKVINEQHVLGIDHECLQRGGDNRTSYTFSNGAHFALGGTDKIEQHLSSEWDLVYFFEATQPGMREYDWTTIGTRMRNTGVPHPHCDYPYGIYDDGRDIRDVLIQSTRFAERLSPDGRTKIGEGCDDRNVPLFWRQRVAECNPSMIEGEQHWLMRRWKSGQMVRLCGVHADNPLADESYLETLREAPEPWRSVYYEGKWVSLGGKCWPAYKPDRHLILGSFSFNVNTGRSYVTVTESSWCERGQPKVFPIVSVVAGFDWGINHPGSLQVFAVTANKKAFRIAEILHTGLEGEKGSLDWWAAQVVELVDLYRIQVIRCDPSARAIYEMFNARLGARCGRTVGGICQGADNTIQTGEAWMQGGIDLVNTMFQQDRLFLLEDCHHGPVDPSLFRKHAAIGLHEEIPGYLLARDPNDPERVLPYPDKKRGNDNAVDACRYACMDIFSNDRNLKPKRLTTMGHLDPNMLSDEEEERLLVLRELEAPASKPRRW